MTESNAEQSRCIIVLGLQGSGTSAVAGVLHNLGVVMGKRLAGPDPNNPESWNYVEDLDFREMLYEYNRTKQRKEDIEAFLKSRYAEFNLWGLKEPQAGHAIADFTPFLNDYRVILCVRHKMACVRSAVMRRTSKGKSLDEIYANHRTLNMRLREFINEHKPTLLKVKFNDLTSNPTEIVNKIAEFAFYGHPAPAAWQFEGAVGFVDPSLNHHREEHGDGTKSRQM